MIKNIPLIFLFSVIITFAQERPKPVLIEHNSVLTDSVQKEIISYRIPYKNLLFIKNGNVYNSTISLTFEFFIDDKFIVREIVNPQLTVDNYDETLSAEEFYQDYIIIELEPGIYSLRTIMSLGETDMEYKIPDHKISVDSVKTNNFFGPVIISSLFTNSEYTMANFGNSIPFSPAKYSLLFGVKSEISDSLAVVVKQMDKEIFNKVLRPKAIGKMNIERSRGDIKLLISDTSGYNYFIAGGFSHLLYEGLSEIKVQYDGNDKKFDLKTSWIEKPRVLNNPEYSIKLLGYIENENVVGELLSSDEEDYYKNLTEYWIKNYPADGMKFNYAMEEYYSRADYAIENFSSLNAFDGAERDRGKIYILYGPPTTTERNYTEMNEILEIWSYKNLARKFIFKDVNGTGKFDLTE